LFQPTEKDTFSFLVIHFSVTETIAAPRKGNEQERKTYNSLTWSDKMTLQRCNAPFQTRGMRSFLASAVLQSASAFTTQRESPWTRKSVTLQNFKWRVTLQNFRSPAMKWKVDH